MLWAHIFDRDISSTAAQGRCRLTILGYSRTREEAGLHPYRYLPSVCADLFRLYRTCARVSSIYDFSTVMISLVLSVECLLTYPLVTPERLQTADFMRVLEEVYSRHQLRRLVIDEAHCISEWGHDFREEYRKLDRFRLKFPDVPIMALTASATPVVQDDIVRSLRLDTRTMYKIVHPFNRENLFYEVRYHSTANTMDQCEAVFAFIANLHERRHRTWSLRQALKWRD